MDGTVLPLLLLLATTLFLSARSQPSSPPLTTNRTDLEALLAIKSHITSDPHGAISAAWNTTAPFCLWPGVSCSRRRPRVTALTLRSLSLGGAVSPHVANLSFLSSLDLSNNSLAGSLPAGLGRLPRLRDVNLSVNSFTGSMPIDLFNSSSLESIVLAVNQLSGTIPEDGAFRLPRLIFLSLVDNQLTGRIPISLGRCTNLQILSLSYNQFVGPIPPELARLPKLRILYLGDNNLTGAIPRLLSNLTGLQVVSIVDNMITGEIPEELGQLQSMQLLNLAKNELTGAAPSSIFNISSMQKLSLSFNGIPGRLPDDIGLRMPNLQELYISENRFTGRIPSSLSNASMLSILEFSYNFLSGSVPTALGDLQLLKTLSLQGNQLENGLGFITSLTRCRLLENLLIGENNFGGQLPESIGNLSTNLLRLGIPNCQLIGEIPASLGNISSLIYLNLHDNRLSGALPPSIGQLKNLQLIYLYINMVEGPIPQELCQLRALSILFLYENMFSGSIPSCLGNITGLSRLSIAANTLWSTIPSSIWNLQNLYFLNLSMNSLVGSLSPEVGNLKTLGQLDLSQNQLTGSIPSTVGELQMLMFLVLSYNSFSGPIPQSFKQLINMEGMDLSSNALTGSIPRSLANLSYFSFLNLSFNRLEGEIPHGGVFANLTAESFEGNTALCGESKLGVPPCTTYTTNTKSRARLLKYILPVVASVIAVAILICLILLFKKKKKMILLSVDQSIRKGNHIISYHELFRATENFNETNLLGVGSHGSVYKARLDDGTIAAIKVLNLEAEGASKSFDAECQVLRMARHRNLVKIISTCSNFEFKALVLQYMSNGSLERWLHSDDCYLSLAQRVSILLDVALALEYLHHEYSEVVVHCDLKPSNVLLDEGMSAHVGDFGLAKLLAGGKSIMQSSAPGTFGYMAPEYGSTGRVSVKGDVYSYGILLLEMLTGKKPTDERFLGASSLKEWVNEAFPNSTMKVVDQSLLEREVILATAQESKSTYKNPGGKHQCLLAAVEMALLCSKDHPSERISMKDAVVRLKRIKMELNRTTSGTQNMRP